MHLYVKEVILSVYFKVPSYIRKGIPCENCWFRSRSGPSILHLQTGHGSFHMSSDRAHCVLPLSDRNGGIQYHLCTLLHVQQRWATRERVCAALHALNYCQRHRKGGTRRNKGKRAAHCSLITSISNKHRLAKSSEFVLATKSRHTRNNIGLNVWDEIDIEPSRTKKACPAARLVVSISMLASRNNSHNTYPTYFTLLVYKEMHRGYLEATLPKHLPPEVILSYQTIQWI